MESSDCNFLASPHPEVFENSVEDDQVFVVPAFEVVLDLIGIIPLAHETIGRLVDIVVPLLRNFLSYVFNVDVVPVLFLVYEGES
mgnify:CR=1 FL=1